LVSQAAALGIDAEPIGRVGGPAIVIGESAVVALETLREAHEGWFAAFMDAAPLA
jgi:phosphoribosylformylglycinamidine synthase subunit PurL